MNFRFKKPIFLSKNKKVNNRIVALLAMLLFALTILGTTHNFRFAMMGLITFVLAYLSKGIRRRSFPESFNFKAIANGKSPRKSRSSD